MLYFVLYFLQAKGLLSEYQPKYNSARAVYREKKKYIDEIDWNMLAIPAAGSCKVFFESIISCKKHFLHFLNFEHFCSLCIIYVQFLMTCG